MSLNATTYKANQSLSMYHNNSYPSKKGQDTSAKFVNDEKTGNNIKYFTQLYDLS
jgi:hypothetical protein